MVERYDFRTKRLHVSHDLVDNGTIEADRAQSNYLLNVLRLKSGMSVLLFNGKDGEWLAEIQPIGRKACMLALKEQLRPQPAPYDLMLCFAPLKQARLDYMVQKAVEMGAGQLQPVITRYTQVQKLNNERVEANVLEAAEQCGILSIPNVKAPTSLDQLLENWLSDQPDRQLIFCDELEEGARGMNALLALDGQPIALLIGPEGGFTAEERHLLKDKPFVQPLSLGPRILRADTAAVAAMTLIQAFIGDYR